MRRGSQARSDRPLRCLPLFLFRQCDDLDVTKLLGTRGRKKRRALRERSSSPGPTPAIERRCRHIHVCCSVLPAHARSCAPVGWPAPRARHEETPTDRELRSFVGVGAPAATEYVRAAPRREGSTNPDPGGCHAFTAAPHDFTADACVGNFTVGAWEARIFRRPPCMPAGGKGCGDAT